MTGHSGPGSNDNEGVLHTAQFSRTGASSSDTVLSYPEDTQRILIPTTQTDTPYSRQVCSSLNSYVYIALLRGIKKNHYTLSCGKKDNSKKNIS